MFTYIYIIVIHFQSRKRLYIHQCPLVRQSVRKQNPSTAWNHHHSSFIILYSPFIILHSYFLHIATFKLFSLFEVVREMEHLILFCYQYKWNHLLQLNLVKNSFPLSLLTVALLLGNLLSSLLLLLIFSSRLHKIHKQEQSSLKVSKQFWSE